MADPGPDNATSDQPRAGHFPRLAVVEGGKSESLPQKAGVYEAQLAEMSSWTRDELELAAMDLAKVADVQVAKISKLNVVICELIKLGGQVEYHILVLLGVMRAAASAFEFASLLSRTQPASVIENLRKTALSMLVEQYKIGWPNIAWPNPADFPPKPAEG